MEALKYFYLKKFFPAVKKYKFAIAIFFIWLIIQLVFFHFLGVAHGGDTGRYLGGAGDILNGKFPAGKASSYLGYDFFLALIFFFKLGEKGVVFVQIALALLAAFCLYKLTYKLSQNKLASFLAVILYIFSLELQAWNFYILTDSLFASMTIISLYLLACLKNYKQLIYVIPIVLWTASIRPTGFILLISTVFFALAYLWKIQKKKLVFVILALALLSSPFLFRVVDKMAGREMIVDYYLKGEIIWGYANNTLATPKNIFIDPNYAKNSLPGIFSFAWYNFGFIAKLAGLKLFYFFAHTKPFYSAAHSWLIAIAYYPIYILAAIGFFKKTINWPAKIMLLSYLIGQTLIVALTFEDWDGRFLEVLMPIVYIFSALGFIEIWTHLKKAMLKSKKQTRILVK